MKLSEEHNINCKIFSTASLESQFNLMKTAPQITAQQAQAAANQFLSERLPDRLTADTALLSRFGLELTEAELRTLCDCTPLGTEALKAVNAARQLGWTKTVKLTLTSASGRVPLLKQPGA